MGLHQKSWTFSPVSQSYWEKPFIISSLSEIPKLMLCLGCISFKRNPLYVSGLRQMGTAGAAIRPCFPPLSCCPPSITCGSIPHWVLQLHSLDNLPFPKVQREQIQLRFMSLSAQSHALVFFLSWILLAFCPRSALSNSCWPPVRLISASCQLVICSGKLEQLTLDKAVKVGVISCKYVWK